MDVAEKDMFAETRKDIGFAPDVVHAHDWQTALACLYLKIWHWNDPVLGKAASVLTLHNLAYQGVYRGCISITWVCCGATSSPRNLKTTERLTS